MLPALNWRLLLRAWSVAAALLLCVAPQALSAADAPAAQSPEAAVLHFRAAVALQNKSVFDLASDEWAAFLKRFPDDPLATKARHYRGVCLLQLQKYDEAKTAFEAVLAKQPDFEFGEQTMFDLGLAYSGLKQNGKAAETFAKLLVKYPHGKLTARALYTEGDALYAAGKKEAAYQAWKELLEKQSTKPGDTLRSDTLYSAGVVLQELGRPDEARQDYDLYLKENPQGPQAAEVSLYKGETLMGAKSYPEAEQAFQFASQGKDFPQADQALMRQADALGLQKKYDAAAALYLTLPTRFPKSEYLASSNLYAGNNFYLAGKYPEARDSLNQVLSAGGEHAAEAAHWIARSWLKEAKATEALKVVNAILPKAEKSKHYVDLLMDQADASFDLPDHKSEAMTEYAAVAEKFPDASTAPQALYNAAFAALGLEKYDEALAFAKKFFEKYPKHPLALDVKMVSAESQLLSKHYAEAESLYQELIAQDPSHPEAEQWRLRLALALSFQKKYDDVVKNLKAALPSLKRAENQAEAYYLQGSAQLELKQPADAIKSLETALKTLPPSKSADKMALALAQAQRQAGDLKAASATIQKLMKDNPQSKLLDQAHFRLGEYASAAKDYPTAVAEYQQVLTNNPDSPFVANALFGLGWTQINQQDYAAADKTFGALLEKHPMHELALRSHYARAVARQQLGNFSGAVEDLQPYLESKLTNEERSDALYVRGLSEEGLKQFSAAVKTFAEILKNDPKYAAIDKVLYETGWAYKGDKQEAEAADAFARLAKDCPSSPLAAEALYHTGEYQYHEKKDYAAAAAAYFEAVNKAGKTDIAEKADHKLGWAYYQQGDFDRAQKTFASELQQFPTGELAPDAQFMSAECLFKQNKYKEALSAYELAAKSKPSSKDFETLTLLHAGQSASQLKDWSKAQEYLDRCAKEFPDSPYLAEVEYEQGWVKKNQDKLDEAQKLFEKAADAAPTRIVGVRARFMQGEILFQKKDYSDAVRQYFMVAYSSPQGAEFQPWQAHATYEAALCLESLNKKGQAKKLYQEVLDKYPKSEHTDEAKKRLAAIDK
ncbi:MAG TPA: tetratricopeptide repeat protein [Pirellulales bacterium]|jgi:TolA-binding protein|nr:tetratricopeptide repeat protein [Pirellulales bacterium]